MHPTGRFRGPDRVTGSRCEHWPGFRPNRPSAAIAVRPFLKYQIITVAAAEDSLTTGTPSPSLLREQNWMLGPSAGGIDGEIAGLLRSLAIPESAQRIFREQQRAALEEVQRVGGVSVAVEIRGRHRPSTGQPKHVKGPGLQLSGEWSASTLSPAARQPAVTELLNFITTPRCTQAMIRGTGVGVTRFRPEGPRHAVELTGCGDLREQLSGGLRPVVEE